MRHQCHINGTPLISYEPKWHNTFGVLCDFPCSHHNSQFLVQRGSGRYLSLARQERVGWTVWMGGTKVASGRRSCIAAWRLTDTTQSFAALLWNTVVWSITIWSSPLQLVIQWAHWSHKFIFSHEEPTPLDFPTSCFSSPWLLQPLLRPEPHSKRLVKSFHPLLANDY